MVEQSDMYDNDALEHSVCAMRMNRDTAENSSRPSFGLTIGDRFDPRANNFDLVRLLLAVIVVFCHCFSVIHLNDPLTEHLHYGYGGTLAVDSFLVISGFLVTRSAFERPLDLYVRSRIARIVPGLAFVTLFEVFVVGPVFTSANLWTYFTYVGFRHLWNVCVFGLDSSLYSVFPNTDPPWLINGSLWTIPIECSFYILLPVIMLFGRLDRTIVPLFFVSVVALPFLRYFGITEQKGDISLMTNVHLFSFIDLSSFFLAGSAAWLMRDRVPCNTGALLISLIGLYAAAGVGLSGILLRLFLPYIVLHVSLCGESGTQLKRRIGDLSYGIYLFGFPITLSVMTAWPEKIGIYTLILLTLLVTTLCAWVSWHVVEEPFLRLRWSRRPREI